MKASFSKPLSQSECTIKIMSQLLSKSECRNLGCDLTPKPRHNADKHYLLILQSIILMQRNFFCYNWVLVVTEFVVSGTQYIAMNTNLSDNVDTHIELRLLPDNLAAPPVALATSSRSVQVQLFDCKICTSPLQLYNNISLTIRSLTYLCVNYMRLKKSTAFIKMTEANSSYKLNGVFTLPTPRETLATKTVTDADKLAQNSMGICVGVCVRAV